MTSGPEHIEGKDDKCTQHLVGGEHLHRIGEHIVHPHPKGGGYSRFNFEEEEEKPEAEGEVGSDYKGKTDHREVNPYLKYPYLIPGRIGKVLVQIYLEG